MLSLFGDEENESFVEVALPVPLHRLFTYRVPAKFGALRPGMRVAVPFGPRRLPGIVVRVCEKPADVRLRDVAGVFEPEPIFTDELFRLLVDAADYYIAPLGEVLRSASPALPTEALRDLKKGGFLRDDDSMPGSRIAQKSETFVSAVLAAESGKLGAKQAAVLAEIKKHDELSMSALRALYARASEAVKALEQKKLVTTETREVISDPFFREIVDRDTPPELHPAQAEIVRALHAELDKGTYTGALLHGVTGSGKTEIYLRVIERARALSRGAILLVPEIALTPQLVSRFRARFGDGIAVLHSELTDREKHDAWQALRSGRVHLAIGARSAIFAPVQNLGVIVVDEEHDPSFKQEDGFRYQGRDLALLRASRAKALCILGSATPAIETYELAREKKILLFELKDRATPKPLPRVQIVDLARHKGTPSGNPLIAAPLHRALEKCLADRGQAILFLNRRGFAPSVRCDACNASIQCPACSVALTEHRRAGVLRCHYCDYTIPISNACPSCGALALMPIGLGTEKLETDLSAIFPGARVARLDRDVASTGEGSFEVLQKMRRGEIDILVGTQMVTKGHDLPNVTLVGVVLADQSLAFPDFRAAERTFQLVAQVAGRAGRGAEEGHVILQTYQPTHFAMQCAAQHDYQSFFEKEVEARRELAYAPFTRLVAIRVDAGDDEVARRVAHELSEVALALPECASGAVQILGPAPAPFARLRGRYRHRLFLRSADRKKLRVVARAIVARIEEGIAPARASVDVDPVNML